MQTGSSPTGLHNRLLASLPEDVTQRLLPSLEVCVLPHGKVLYEIGAPLHHAYFPIDAILSLQNVTAAANVVEICVDGNDGMIGNSLFMGLLRSPTKAVALGNLHRLGVIERCEGHIHVCAHKPLEELSCECYRVIKSDTARLLATPEQAQGRTTGSERAVAVDRFRL